MFRRISPHGTRERHPGKWALLPSAALLAVAAIWVLWPAAESPAGPAGAADEAPRPRSGYENRALWRGPASPAARTPAITGTVYDLRGGRLADAVVTAATFQVAGNQPTRVASVKTDAAGRFELPVPAGSYYVSGDKAGYGPARTVAHSGDEVGLVLVPSGVVTGRVVDERNQPVQRFSIDVIGPMTEDYAAPPAFVSKRFDSVDGSFLIDQLPDMPVTLRASAAEYAPSVSPMLAAPPGETVTVELRLDSGCTLSGVVADEEGAPLADVLVDAELRANAGVIGTASIDAVSQADSDAEGRFTLEHVPRGDVQIRAYDGAHAVATAALRIDDCASVAPVRLRMTAGSELFGRVITADGEPVPDARVTLMHQSIGFVSTASARDGRYRFTRLPAGTMRIEAARGAQRAVLLVPMGETGAAELDLVLAAPGTGEIRGRVTGGGQPLAGMQLMIVTHQGKGTLDTMYSNTDADGNYRVAGLAPGLYAVAATSTSRFRSVGLESGEVKTVDLDVAVKREPPPLTEEMREKLRRMQEEHDARREASPPAQQVPEEDEEAAAR